MRENYRYPGSYLDDEDYEAHCSDLTGVAKWIPEYSVEGDKMVFQHIDTPEKRLVMIKAYESLEGGRKDEQD